MVMFLSAGLGEQVQEQLISGGYAPDTPAAVVYKASWPEERVLRCTVGTLAKTIAEAGVRQTALITVGRFLSGTVELSKLYDPGFAHGWREAHP
jgi:precorrin-4/cobalt-precorrin-4 C11-methyltransferase